MFEEAMIHYSSKLKIKMGTWSHIRPSTVLSDQNKITVILNFFKHFMFFTLAFQSEHVFFSLCQIFPSFCDEAHHSSNEMLKGIIRPRPGWGDGPHSFSHGDWSNSRAGDPGNSSFVEFDEWPLKKMVLSPFWIRFYGLSFWLPLASLPSCREGQPEGSQETKKVKRWRQRALATYAGALHPAV